MVVAGDYRRQFSLANSMELPFLPIFEPIDTKRLLLEKIFNVRI